MALAEEWAAGAGGCGHARIVCQDLHAFLDSDSGRYDLICLFEVLEHLEVPEQVVERCRGLLAKDGKMIGSVPVAMPYPAHLQVFESMAEARDRLSPSTIVERRGHWFLSWTGGL